jgi:hypothetical protein
MINSIPVGYRSPAPCHRSRRRRRAIASPLLGGRVRCPDVWRHGHTYNWCSRREIWQVHSYSEVKNAAVLVREDFFVTLTLLVQCS